MTGFEPTPQGFADLHTDRYTTLRIYLVFSTGFEPTHKVVQNRAIPLCYIENLVAVPTGLEPVILQSK